MTVNFPSLKIFSLGMGIWCLLTFSWHPVGYTLRICYILLRGTASLWQQSDVLHGEILYASKLVTSPFLREVLVSFSPGASPLLFCLTGNPEPEISWFHEDQALSTSCCRQRYDGQIARLIFKRFTSEFVGDFRCRASNCVGEALSSCRITLKGDYHHQWSVLLVSRLIQSCVELHHLWNIALRALVFILVLHGSCIVDLWCNVFMGSGCEWLLCHSKWFSLCYPLDSSMQVASCPWFMLTNLLTSQYVLLCCVLLHVCFIVSSFSWLCCKVFRYWKL